MIHIKNIIIIIPFFILSCANGQYLKSYEPINSFLDTQEIDKNKNYVLQVDKEENTQALRIFNGGDGEKYLIDYTDDLFAEKYWKKMYKEYAYDTIKRYWKKEDFPQYNFILEKGTGLTLKESFLRKYMDSRISGVIILSEPLYYMDKKYIMFLYDNRSFEGSGSPKVVIMKKDNEKWLVVKIIGDYIYN